MNWFDAVDTYCERLAPGFGAEPVNMLTGLGFLVAGLWAFRRAPAREDRQAALALALVGIGSAAQHGFGLALTLWVDLVANLAYLSVLGSLMMQRLGAVARLPALAASVMVVALATAVGASPALRQIFGLATDSFFLLLLVILGAALVLARHHAQTSRGLLLAAVALALGLPFRFLDGVACPFWPPGTHGIWHLANAASSALLLASLARHAGPGPHALAKGGEGR